ncbi:hypothetical protein [Streptacidiphilus anmyonensis]|uniref:hypothetical protein n=1 Tax=Streptacidiphilus anmyonensis TaxID=405782 RepID=UPI001F2F2DEA|nr:hypothetical protein [Streptacidiphilus anmyonensis]
MHRLLRYGLIWLICTTLTVTVGFFAVGIVMDSAGGTPPTVQADDSTGDDPSASASPLAASSLSPFPSPSAGAVSASPVGSRGASATGHRASATPSPRGTGTSMGTGTGSGSCQGGVGAHTVHSQGGQASVMFGSSAVCLISAVPAPGFTAQTQQPDPGTLVITFCGSTHRSTITAHLSPEPGSEIRETSWQIPSTSMC